MNIVEENIEYLRNIYQTLKNDFENQKHDLHFLKSHANILLTTTSTFKLNETISFSDHQQGELIKTAC